MFYGTNQAKYILTHETSICPLTYRYLMFMFYGTNQAKYSYIVTHETSICPLTYRYLIFNQFSFNFHREDCTNPGCQVARPTKLGKVAPKICGSSGFTSNLWRPEF